jgi:hypothetical protein
MQVGLDGDKKYGILPTDLQLWQLVADPMHETHSGLQMTQELIEFLP